jgi:predicted ArsR family transcriptional regulator
VVTDPDTQLARDIAGVAVLDEPVRRALFEYVAAHGEPVSRDQAAAAAGTTRENAAFHLDRLVGEGLLETSFKRLSGRTGPGAGRPSKLYRRSSRQLDVSVPPRRYALLAGLLADAVAGSKGKDPRREVAKAARSFGSGLGSEARARVGARAGRAALLWAAVTVLDEHGFAPVETPRGTVRLRNCPFDALAKLHPDLVCAMNLSLIEGLLAGLDAAGLAARLDPQPGRCCVTLAVTR